VIIFFDKEKGNIVGSIGGNKHYKGEDKFWVGDKKYIDRILYSDSAPFFNEVIKDPLFATKFKVDVDTGVLVRTKALGK